MVRPERGGAEKARSVTARRDEGDKMLQSHTGFCSQSIPTDIEIQLPLSIHLHFRSSVHLFLQCILLYLSLSTQSFTHTFAFSKKKKKMPIFIFFLPILPSSCLYSITGSLYNLMPCASITLVPFSCDEAQLTAVLIKPYTCMTNTSWGLRRGPE